MSAISQCKTILYASKLRYPEHPSYMFPVFMLLKYLKLIKRKAPFKITAIPQELITKLLKNNTLIDANNCVLISAGYFKAILNSSEYAKIKYGENERLVQILPADILDGEILLSETLHFNLNKIARCKLLPAETSNIQIGPTIELSLITAPQSISLAVTDLILKNYFKNPKLLYKNDVVAVNLREFGPDFYYTNTRLNEVDYVYFKCNGVGDNAGGYFCAAGVSELKQSADTQGFLPPKVRVVRDYCEEGAKYGDCLVNRCPSGLVHYMERLEKGIKPFISKKKIKLNAAFLIQGPKGSGKDVILSSLAAKYGLHLCKLSTNDLSSHAYAQTEIKMRNAFFRAKMCSPCIVAIYNFENFCKNNEGHHDPRIINYFKAELNTLLSNNEHPIVLVCSSNSKDLPSELSRLFLETITIDAPNQNERRQILAHILTKKSLQHAVDLDAIAGKTHGFVLGDLDALIYYAEQNMIFNFAEVACLREQDFESALDTLQSSYTESLGAPKVPKVNWSDVGGLEDVKHEIIKTINLPLKHPELLKNGLKRSGILLYGPPGTGKTLMAKAVATECGLCFLSVKGPELLNMYVGQSEQNVREVFEKARQASPCIIFFDELDSLAPNRGISGDSGGVMDRVVSQLLSEMDGLNQNATIFVIGATNRPDLIDPALLRPGRFDKLLYVGPCTDASSKLGVLQALTRKFKLSEKMNLEKVVKTCPENITGADFYGICSNAWMAAASRLVKKIEKGKIEKGEYLTHENVIVTFKDFEEAIKNTKPSISPKDLLYFEKLKKELGSKK